MTFERIDNHSMQKMGIPLEIEIERMSRRIGLREIVHKRMIDLQMSKWMTHRHCLHHYCLGSNLECYKVDLQNFGKIGHCHHIDEYGFVSQFHMTGSTHSSLTIHQIHRKVIAQVIAQERSRYQMRKPPRGKPQQTNKTILQVIAQKNRYQMKKHQKVIAQKNRYQKKHQRVKPQRNRCQRKHRRAKPQRNSYQMRKHRRAKPQARNSYQMRKHLRVKPQMRNSYQMRKHRRAKPQRNRYQMRKHRRVKPQVRNRYQMRKHRMSRYQMKHRRVKPQVRNRYQMKHPRVKPQVRNKSPRLPRSHQCHQESLNN